MHAGGVGHVTCNTSPVRGCDSGVQPRHAPDNAPRGRTTRPSNNELLAVAEQHWPQPRLRTRARRAGQRWVVGCARWPGPGHAARPSAWSSKSAGRDQAAGAAPSAAATPHHAKHQHKHDHDDQHPQPCRHGGLLGRRRAVRGDATVTPPEQATRSRPGDLPGPDRRPCCARARGDPAPCTPRPARRSGLARRVPARPRPCQATAGDGGTTRLSRYNPARRCAIHQGWDQQETTRTRQHRF